MLDARFKIDLSYLDRDSRKNEDKISKTDLNVDFIENTPYFKEASLVMICKKLYAQNLEPNCFIDKSLDNKWYENKDYHTMYVSEIQKIFIKD